MTIPTDESAPSPGDPIDEDDDSAASEAEAPLLQKVDERWTIPWAVVAEDVRPIASEAHLIWHGAASTFSHAGHDLPRPMLYTSSGRTADAETSCIDTQLPVATPDFTGAPPLHHWAGYASLTPTQRANYLAWLASDRSMPLDDINYAFLYFYGLERYALIDKGDPEEVLRVLMRLLRNYEASPSFFSSASRLAAFLFATKGIEKLKPAWFKRLFMQRAVPLHSDSIAVATTWLYERGKPLPPELAFEIAQQDIRCPREGAYLSDRPAFETAFKAAYTAQFGEGMTLQIAEKAQTWKYRPINPSLQSWNHFSALWSVSAADVMAAQHQFAPLIALWRTSLGEVVAPKSWTAFIAAHAGDDGRVLLPVARLAAHIGIPITKGQDLGIAASNQLVETSLAAGYEVLPNPKMLLRPFKARERVVLTRAEPCHRETEPFYLAGVLLLALGTAMAEVDGEVDHVEVLHVSEIVNSLYHFNDYDKHRLGVLRRRLIKFPPKLASLTRRVRAILDGDACIDVGHFLVGVAGANFSICDDERLALRRAYRALGIPVTQLDEKLGMLIREEEGDGGHHRIDEAVLAEHMRQTKAFAERLGRAMQAVQAVEENAADKGKIWFVRVAHADNPAAELASAQDDPYGDALYALVQQPDWTDAEFVALAEKHGKFLAGGVATGDAWFEEASDAQGGRFILAPDDTRDTLAH